MGVPERVAHTIFLSDRDVLLARHARVLLEQWQRRAIFWCFTARRLAVPKMWPTKCAPLPFDAILHRGACR